MRKKEKMKNLLLLALILPSPAALSAPPVVPPTFCGDADAIFAKVQSCEQNGAFAQAGGACLAKLEIAVKQATAALTASFSKNTDAAQSKRFESSEADYQKAIDNLRQLIHLTEVARIDVHDYMEHLALPEDEEDESEEESSVPCFADTNEKLKEIAKAMDAKQTELEKALEAAAANHKTSALRKDNIQSGPVGAAPALKAEGKTQSPAVNGKNWRPSDISGTEDKKVPSKGKP